MKNFIIKEKFYALMSCICLVLIIRSEVILAREPTLDWPLTQEDKFDTGSRLRVLTEALKEAYKRELNYYNLQEARIINQISALESQKKSIQARKRSHVQCLVNVIACYRKRK